MWFRHCCLGYTHLHVWQNFDFALYVSLNFDRILADFYNFHVSAWLCVLSIKAVECVALVSIVFIAQQSDKI